MPPRAGEEVWGYAVNEERTISVTAGFLAKVLTLCQNKGSSPKFIENFDPHDKWIADLWREADDLHIQVLSQPEPELIEYVGSGMFKGETMQKAAEHWANWCDRRMLDGLAEFLRVVAATPAFWTPDEIAVAKESAKKFEHWLPPTSQMASGVSSEDAARWKWLTENCDGDDQDDFTNWLCATVADKASIDAKADEYIRHAARSDESAHKEQP